jgi:hypothetical protein
LLFSPIVMLQQRALLLAGDDGALGGRVAILSDRVLARLLYMEGDRPLAGSGAAVSDTGQSIRGAVSPDRGTIALPPIADNLLTHHVLESGQCDRVDGARSVLLETISLARTSVARVVRGGTLDANAVSPNHQSAQIGRECDRTASVSHNGGPCSVHATVSEDWGSS